MKERKLAVCGVLPVLGHFLSVTRKDNFNKIGFIGGKVDDGESLEEALTREGFIRESVVDAILYILYISIASSLIIFIIFYSNIFILFKILWCVISFFVAAIPVCIIEEYAIKKGLTLYFGLGHKK